MATSTPTSGASTSGATRRAKVVTRKYDAYVVAASANGRLFGVAFGDGNVRLVDSENIDADPTTIAAHSGAVLSLAPDLEAGAFLTGGDDGKVVRTAPPAVCEVIAEEKGRWIDHVTAHAGAGVRAYASGKEATILAKGKPPRKIKHPTAVGGLAINPKGKRLAASHYNGVSLWWLGAEGNPTVLEWKGSHLNLAWSPDGDYLISCMQENSLHGWRLADGELMRMTGYAAKIRSMAFTRRGHFLATGGADAIICWPFTGGGPMGRAPLEFGHAGGTPVTAVAANPKHDVIAAGFEDGTLLIGQPGLATPALIVMGEGAAITAAAWNPDGDRLLAGAEDGTLHIADFRL